MSGMLSNEDNEYLLSLIKENKMAEAVKFARERTGMNLRQAKEYVDKTDKKEFQNNILNEEIPYEGSYFFDKKLNAAILGIRRQRKVNKIMLYILLIFVVASLMQLFFLDKASFNQILILFFCIAAALSSLILWISLALNIYVTEKKISRIKELELSNEFEIKSLRNNGTLFFDTIIFIILIFVFSAHIDTALKGLTYKKIFYIIFLTGIISFNFYNFLKELKNRKYSLDISGKTVKILYEDNEINTVRTDNINYAEFYSESARRSALSPSLKIFDSEQKILAEMTVKKEDYHILTMYFIKHGVLVQDKYNQI